MQDDVGTNEAGTPEALFAERMRAARALRGLSQEELAKKLKAVTGLDLHPTAITRIERCERNLRLNEAAAIAKVLGLDIRRATVRSTEQVVMLYTTWESSAKAVYEERRHEHEAWGRFLTYLSESPEAREWARRQLGWTLPHPGTDAVWEPDEMTGKPRSEQLRAVLERTDDGQHQEAP